MSLPVFELYPEYNGAMSSSKLSDGSRPSGSRRFATTHWSVVLAAGRPGSAESADAMVSLCKTYWYPLYAYVRRRGHDAVSAQDLTQEFFARLLEKNYVAQADRARGKFRSFLLASLNHFLAKEWRRVSARKRGGGCTLISLDFEAGERRYSLEPSHDLTPEKMFERRWALNLLAETLSKVRDEYAIGGKLKLFDHLKPYLGGDKNMVPYRQIAAELGMTLGTVKVAVHRLRRRCRELLVAEIAQTVAGPEEIEEELRDLFQAVAL
jgi:RNA polymerase sigma factor (sigma-70 family)